MERLQKRVEPLKGIKKELTGLDGRIRQVEGFLARRGEVLAAMRVLAQRLPGDAWIRNLDYREGRVRVSIEGGRAVDLMEALKGIEAFASIRLASPVTKYRGKERYVVEIVLKGGR